MNRDPDDYLDYSQLTTTIQTAVTELELNLSAVELYSRALGKIELDWQTLIELTNPEVVKEDLEAIALAADVCEHYAKRGIAHYKIGNYDSAIAERTRAIELKPNYAGGY